MIETSTSAQVFERTATPTEVSETEDELVKIRNTQDLELEQRQPPQSSSPTMVVVILAQAAYGYRPVTHLQMANQHEACMLLI